MTWNSNPPKGGPLVEVDGFPYSCYPPDDPQKRETPDGDFVVCLKRWAARCGAWPWDPTGWDDAYSSRFSHGDGWSDPTHAGIAGLQKWSGTLDVTGNVGEKTFNFARSVKVPQGRTHAGEMAFDSVCVDLCNQAYADSHRPPTSDVSIRATALALATKEVGRTENPSGSNLTPYGSWYGENGVPWCAIFTTWAYVHAAEKVGKPCPSFIPLSSTPSGQEDHYDYVPWIVGDARNGRNGLSVTSAPIPGDLVCFDWSNDGEYDHVGLFEEWRGGSGFNAIEGNTSTSDNSNGGQVMRRTRDKYAQGTVFVRVKE